MAHLSWNEVRTRAIDFVREHAGDRSESAQKQTFWNDFFNVFGLRRASLASFEENVRNLKGNKGAIDLLWKGRLLVEHKSFGEDLAPATTQAFTYIEDLTREQRWDELPRYVLVSDFARFVLYDLEPEEQRDLPLFAGQSYAAQHFTLSEFPKVVRHFAFMLGQTRVRLDPEDPANEKAYARMCELHDALKAGGFTGHDLERLLVRILFCLFAEDTLIFAPDAFTQFIRTQTMEDGRDCGARLNELCDWLNAPAADGALADTDPFYGFRYVNGGLFAERLGFPRFNRDMRASLLACCDFQWARISPAVFGSLFQGVMEDRARRQQGAHYTSERDIMKVLRPLFLDELRAEWERVKGDRSTRRRLAMEGFHQKLRSLQFLDPACGCGNFLVLTYRELRLLEIDVVRDIAAGAGGQQLLPIVNVDQFHGLEKEEWPVRIAEVALWLMDHQMNAEAGEVFGQPIDRLPLTSAPHIVHGNALRVDWNTVLPRERCSYVMGNPPFIGKQYRNAEQQADMALVWGEVKGAGVVDYVAAWYAKAARYIEGTRIPVAFVSTNSISQGEQVGILWGELFQRHHLKIHFAHRTFAWASEARGKAHVHVVIIGFGAFDRADKRIFDYEAGAAEPTEIPARNISPYLIEGSDLVMHSRKRPICAVPEMNFGSMPNDGGHLIFSSYGREELLKAEPAAREFLRRFVGAEEFLHGIERWCLWLVDAPAAFLRANKAVKDCLAAVRIHRSGSNRATTRKLANYPAIFGEIRQPANRYILVPGVSSERRKYIPIGFLPPSVVASNLVNVVPDADMWHFGVLSSAMHMAWASVVAGRLKSDFRYSSNIVYNNFPWPERITDKRRAAIEDAADRVLKLRIEHGDGRVGFLPSGPRSGNSTLADLYNPDSMPATLAKAHAELDRAVEKCYRAEPFHSDRERVEHLFRLYEQLTAPLLPATPRTRGRRSPTAAPTPRPRQQKTPGLYAQKPKPPPTGESTPESEAAAAHFWVINEDPPET